MAQIGWSEADESVKTEIPAEIGCHFPGQSEYCAEFALKSLDKPGLGHNRDFRSKRRLLIPTYLQLR